MGGEFVKTRAMTCALKTAGHINYTAAKKGESQIRPGRDTTLNDCTWPNIDAQAADY